MPGKYPTQALAAVHETAVSLHRAGGIDKNTMRAFDALCLTPKPPIKPLFPPLPPS